jgi:hypothetical protein
MTNTILIFVQSHPNAKWEQNETKINDEKTALDYYEDLCKISVDSPNNVQIELSKGLGVIARYANNRFK